NNKRKLTSGDELGKSTDAMLEEAFPASARLRFGAATATINTTAISARRLLTRILLLLVRENDRRALALDEVFLSHLLNVLRRDRGVQLIDLVESLGRALERNVRRKISRDRFGVIQ